MRRLKLKQYLLIFFVLFIASCGNHKGNKRPGDTNALPKITIATAANMQFALEKLAEGFSKQTKIEYELIVSSSGKLTAQIKEGAPYDIFVSADMKYPQEIYNAGLAESPPKVYAYGKLVLWSMVEDIELSVNLLTDSTINHIAIANPKTAPYGVAATEVLSYFGLNQKVGTKLVFGESIAQTNQYIISRSAEVGFTAMSVVLSPELTGKGKWMEMDGSAYTPIEQGVVVIRQNNQSNESAKEFYKFLFSKKAKEILTNFGYAVNE